MGVLCACLWMLTASIVSGRNSSTVFRPSGDEPLQTPLAQNDTFRFVAGCANSFFTGNLLSNDLIDSDTKAEISKLWFTDDAHFSCGPKGNFIYMWDGLEYGKHELTYRLILKDHPEIYSEAEVFIEVVADHDCDGVADVEDLDNDNDGILDVDEGPSDLDSDNDGLPNFMDIDSDNDGITDFEEAKPEGVFYPDEWFDSNGDGWNDVFDPQLGGTALKPVNTDGDDWPDFIDRDADEDGTPDIIEAFMLQNNDSYQPAFSSHDSDGDGLDDFCDTHVFSGQTINARASNAPLPDFNKNGVRDWRDHSNFFSIPGEQSNLLSEENTPNFTVYPNPASDNCWIQIVNPDFTPGETTVFVTDPQGTVLMSKQVPTNLFSLNISSLSSGLYFVVLRNNNQSHSKRLIKTR